jgi:hypothetical protein
VVEIIWITNFAKFREAIINRVEEKLLPFDIVIEFFIALQGINKYPR